MNFFVLATQAAAYDAAMRETIYLMDRFCSNFSADTNHVVQNWFGANSSNARSINSAVTNLKTVSELVRPCSLIKRPPIQPPFLTHGVPDRRAWI